ncbi:MAG: alanine racemase [Rhodospirillales bacterium]|nr:alanine racemase [Rhodospirillales bacterium]
MTDARPAALLTVDLDALVSNWRAMAARARPAACAGVVKGDGYGLGAGPVSRALYRAGCRHFFVARLSEGIELRDFVGEDASVCVLDGLGAGEAETFRRRDLTPSLNDPGQIAMWAAAARAAGERLKANLHFDTGMSRLGLTPGEAEALLTDPAPLTALDLRYVMSHLVSSEEPDNPINAAQLALFHRFRAEFPGVKASFANSSGVFLGADYHYDLVRPGCAVYGINPTPGRDNPVRTVATLEVRILQVREIDHPQTVGYGATWQATRPTKVATIACGYADGWLRSLSGRGAAFIGDRQVPFLGRVSMDLITLDVTDAPGAVPGTMVELLGPRMTVDEVADRAGTNGYEVLTRLGRRFARAYREPAA